MTTNGDDCRKVQERLWRYVDRELSAANLSEVSAHLKGCGACSRLYDARSRDARLIRLAFDGSPFGEGFAERFRRRLEDEIRSAPAGARGPGGESLRGRGPARRDASPRLLFARAALAAALLTIAALILYGLRPGETLGTLDLEPVAGVSMERGGGMLRSPDRRLRSGDRLTVEKELSLTLADGSRLKLGPRSVFRVDSGLDEAGPFRARLERGTLAAVVEKRPAERGFWISSPEAVAKVVGTRFNLEVAAGESTLLSVEEGKVRFWGADLSAEASVEATPESGPYLVLAGQPRPRAVRSPHVPVDSAHVPAEGTGEGTAVSSPSKGTVEPPTPVAPGSPDPGLDRSKVPAAPSPRTPPRPSPELDTPAPPPNSAP